MFARVEQEDLTPGQLNGGRWQKLKAKREGCAPAAGAQMGSREACTETAQEEFNTSSSARMIV